ncbi:MAG TPA: hypothetical protein P5114_05875 [Hyphomicrobiaceae bacterium]|nr:hypothetical protein [Hyphomicrobiaceae bacterium]
MKKTSAVFVAVIGIVLTGATWSMPVHADDNGLAAAIHTLKREGRKLCQDGHFHNGTSAGAISKKAATIEAIEIWQGFTAMEYGTDWANFRNAGSKTVKCTKGASGWGCDAQGRPCKRR